MPNWVYNEVSLNGEPKDIKKLLDFVKGDTDFDFNKIIPMPEELNIKNSSITDLSVIIENYKQKGESEDYLRRYKNQNESIEETIDRLKEEKRYDEDLGKKGYDNYKKYGYSTWYTWRNNHWNTKWNANDVIINENNNLISFDTAWDVPYPIFAKLSELFPKITISTISEFESGDDTEVHSYLDGEEVQLDQHSKEYNRILKEAEKWPQ